MRESLGMSIATSPTATPTAGEPFEASITRPVMRIGCAARVASLATSSVNAMSARRKPRGSRDEGFAADCNMRAFPGGAEVSLSYVRERRTFVPHGFCGLANRIERALLLAGRGYRQFHRGAIRGENYFSAAAGMSEGTGWSASERVRWPVAP